MRDVPAAANVPATASVAVADVLDAPARPATVLGVFPSALYAGVGDAVVAVVARDGLRLPNAVVIGQPSCARPFAAAGHGAAVTVGGGGVRIGDVDVRVARWWDPRPRLGPVAPAALATAVGRLDDALPPRSPSCSALDQPAAALRSAIDDGDETAVVEATDGLVGLGPGLTPAGDDVLAGLLAALRLLPDALAAHAHPLTAALAAAVAARAPSATTALSAALLHHAARAEVAVPVARLLRALTGSQPVPPAARDLVEVGHTSGRELAAGIAMGATACLDLVAAPITPRGGDR